MNDTRARRRGRGGKGGHEPRLRIRQREQLVIELHTAGRSQHEIARIVGITQAAVSQIIRRVDERWARENQHRLERFKAEQDRKLNFLHRQALEAWERSKTERRRRRQRQGGAGATGETSVSELIIDDVYGDPRYLETARRVLADLTRLRQAPGVARGREESVDEPAVFTLQIGDDRTAPRPAPETKNVQSEDLP